MDKRIIPYNITYGILYQLDIAGYFLAVEG